MNILNSKKFISDTFGELKNVNNVKNYVKTSMKFYKKNFEEIIKESALNKFDNVTYKTIPKFTKINDKELEKFMEIYEEGNDEGFEQNDYA